MTWTKETLDEDRASSMVAHIRRAIEETSGALNLASYTALARCLRQSDEALGLSTEALLAVLNGEAVVVPKRATKEMVLAACVYEAANPEVNPDLMQNIEDDINLGNAASPYVKREEAQEK